MPVGILKLRKAPKTSVAAMDLAKVLLNIVDHHFNCVKEERAGCPFFLASFHLQVYTHAWSPSACQVTVSIEPEATLDALVMNGAIMKIGVAIIIFWVTKFEST